MLDVYLRMVESALRKARIADPSLPKWIEPEHILGFMIAERPDPAELSADDFIREAREAFETALIAGEDASNAAAKLAGFKKVPTGKIIPFAPVARRALRKDEQDLEKIQRDISRLRSGIRVPNLTLSGALSVERGLLAAIRNKKRLL